MAGSAGKPPQGDTAEKLQTLENDHLCVSVHVQQKGEVEVRQGLVAGRRSLGKCKGALELPLVLGEVPVGTGWWVWLWVWSKQEFRIRNWRGHWDFMFFYVYSLLLGWSENLSLSSMCVTIYILSALCHPKRHWDPAELFAETQSLAGLHGGPQCYDKGIVLTICGKVN